MTAELQGTARRPSGNRSRIEAAAVLRPGRPAQVSRGRRPVEAIPRMRFPLLLVLLLFALPLVAQDDDKDWRDWHDWDHQLDTAYKSSSVVSYAPHDRLLYRKRWSAAELMRLRFMFTSSFEDSVNTELAYEQRLRLTTPDAGAAGSSSTLPSTAAAPFRLGQLDRNIGQERETVSWRHELDRALVAWHPAWGEVVIGRQGIGLGRGVLFGAVDVFAPFSPLEVDREWRRGVDAVRAEYRLSNTSSMEVIAAFGKSWGDSALLGRIRGYLGNVDGELIFGKRGEDSILGLVASTILFDAEVHVEGAVFKTDEDQPAGGGLGGHDRWVGKLVAGGSYTFNIGNGLTVLAEYHYSGFGSDGVGAATARLQSDAEYLERYLRGDTQILGRYALAGQASYLFNNEWSGSLLLMGSPNDGSGVISPSFMWDYADNISIGLSAFWPFGEKPSNGRLRSEYGGSPKSLFLQFNMYF